MNVGPCSRGYMDKRATDALLAYGEWMKYNGRSIYGCTMAEPEFIPPSGTVLTQSEDGKRLYIHLLDYPFFSFGMQNMEGKIKYAQFLHDGSEVLFTNGAPPEVAGQRPDKKAGMVYFNLPTVQPDCLVPVIEVILNT